MFYTRKSPRIPNFDYASCGYYFVTICTYEKECIFGSAENPNVLGHIAEVELYEIEKHYTNIKIDKCVVMPHHVHAIIVIEENAESNLNTVVGQYKSGVTRKIRETQPQEKVWQRSYHDHVIRNEKQYLKIWEYIDNNPKKWELDCFYREA